MSGNTFGTILSVTTFGESHSRAVGAVITGCPAGIALSAEDFSADLTARKPIHFFETGRSEPDIPEILSGIFEGYTLGTPIAVLVRNTEARPHDYEPLKHIYRPGHADFTYEVKYRRRDWRGGGRASGRETAARVLAGTVAKKILIALSPPQQPIAIDIYAVEIAGIPCEPVTIHSPLPPSIESKLRAIRQAGNSAGAMLECSIRNLPAGLGEPVFGKLEAVLAQALLSIGSVKGIAFGSGFDLCRMTGLEANDITGNHHGGIAGGISDGNTLVYRIAVKPVPSIAARQRVYTDSGVCIPYSIQGRHDVCLFRRVMPVAESMTALVLADMLLQQKVNSL